MTYLQSHCHTKLSVIGTGCRPGIHTYDELAPAKIDIEYVDFVVAQSLASVFEDWLATLDKVQIRKTPNWFRNIEDNLETPLAAMTFCAVLLIAFGITSLKFAVFLKTPVQLLGFVVISVAVAVIAATTLYLFGRSFFYRMWPSGAFPFILVTKGDKQSYEKIINKDSTTFRLARHVGASIVGGVISTLVAGLILTYIGLAH